MYNSVNVTHNDTAVHLTISDCEGFQEVLYNPMQ